MTPVKFRGDLWHQKTRLPGVSCGVVCVILRIAVLVEHRLVSDRQTQTETDTGPWLVPRNRGCIASRGNNAQMRVIAVSPQSSRKKNKKNVAEHLKIRFRYATRTCNHVALAIMRRLYNYRPRYTEKGNQIARVRPFDQWRRFRGGERGHCPPNKNIPGREYLFAPLKF